MRVSVLSIMTPTLGVAFVGSLLVGSLLVGCVPGGSDDDDETPPVTLDGGSADGGMGGMGGMGGGGGGDMMLPNVPYEGEIDPLPAEAEVDEQSFFPNPVGGVWRYRRQAANPQSPPPVTEGGERTIEAGEGENEYVLTTVVVIDLPVDGEVTKVRQTIRETLVIEPPDELVGPRVLFKAFDIEEREVGTERFVRTSSRAYEPPYEMILDGWKVGLIGNTLVPEGGVRLMQTTQRRGEEEASEMSGLVNIRVTTPAMPDILIMEGRFREDVYQIDVVDDFTGLLTRTYWVQQGVGVVQWQYRDTNNIIYTLTESNVEVEAE